MAKVAKNLSLDPDVVAKAEKYAQRHQTSLSALVGAFLERLAGEEEALQGRQRIWSPKVERLIGIAQSSTEAEDPEERYHRYLEKKYLG